MQLDRYRNIRKKEGRSVRTQKKTLSPRLQENWDQWLFFLLLAGLAVMLLRKCRYGFANIDEAFYLTIPLRLARGDALVLQEWHLSQLSAFLLVPFVRLWLLLAGGTEGMLLAFRQLYTISQLLEAVAIFFLLRKSSRISAVLGALLWCVYAPFSIMALSYNSMGIQLVTLSMLIRYRCRKGWLLTLSGVLFACAVLCCPFLCLVWVAYALQVLVWSMLPAASWRPDVRNFGFFTLGIGLMAAVFLLYLFRRMSPGRLLQILPLILNDPEHGFNGLLKLRTLAGGVILCGRYRWRIFAGYCALILAGMLCKRSEGKSLCVLGVLLLCAFHLFAMIRLFNYINHLMFPICYAAFACYWIRREEKLKPQFYGLLLPCLLYVPCLHLSSNQILFAMSSASAASMPAAVMMLVSCVSTEERVSRKRLLAGALAALLLFQGGAQLHYRWNSVFWENGPEDQTVRIEEGPEAGLLVSEKKAALYLPRFRELQGLNSREKVLFLSENTWYYLCGDWENAAFSAWLSGVNRDSTEKLLDYYEVNHDKLPDFIYLDWQRNLGSVMPLLLEYDFHVEQVTPLGALVLRRG